MNGKYVGAIIVCLVMTISAGLFAESGHEGHSMGKKSSSDVEQGKKVAIKGEVIDLSCYMNHTAIGDKHRKCGNACLLDKNLPVGLLTDSGRVYVIVEDHAKPKAYLQIKELAAKHVRVRGKKYMRGGTAAISILEVEVLKK